MGSQVLTFVNGKWQENCYLVTNEDADALIVDPGSQAEEIAALVERNRWKVHAILNTHAHYDHVGAVAPLMERFGAPFYLHRGDESLLRRANLYRMLFESRDAVRIPQVTHDVSALPEVFEVGPFRVSWLATPGHTEGSVCFRMSEFLFTGDTLMRNTLGRTDLPGANRELLLASVRKLMTLPQDLVVCGGHGERTTLAMEFSPGSRVWSLLQ